MLPLISAPSLGSGPARRLLVALLAAALLGGASATVAPAITFASTPMMTLCDKVNLRTSASTSATIRASVPTGTAVTVTSTVSGSSWKATCAGKSVSGSSWYRISAIDGKSVSSLYGVSYLYGATGLFGAAPTVADADDPLGAELARLVNLDRAALGKPALSLDPLLASIARDAAFTCPSNTSMTITGRSRDLAVRSYFSHAIKGCAKPDGTLYRGPEILTIVFGYPSTRRTEIIAYNGSDESPATYRIGCDLSGANCKGGTTTAPATVAHVQRTFMSSSTHRNVQLGSYDRIGCGSWRTSGSTRTYYTCFLSLGGPGATAAPAETAMAAACDGVNVRSSASTTSTIRTSLKAGTPVTVNGTVSGGSWKATCAGKSVSGSSWYRITAINGKSVSSLYGVSYVYAASGLLR